MHANPDSFEGLMARMTSLRKQRLTVEPACQDEDSNSSESGYETCGDHLAGRRCKHDAPYCR